MPKDVHLAVLIHGLWGQPSHLAAAKEELVKAHAASSTHLDLNIIVAGGIGGTLTYDGVDVCASRVAWEIDQEITRLDNDDQHVVTFSLMGYSLGGLVARYLLGLLHSRTPSFFTLYKPNAFSTIATPHIGIPRYSTVMSGVFNSLGSRLLSRTGKQLYCADSYSEEDPRPLLEIMADPNEIFAQTLALFPSVQILANAVQDRTVPYPTASFSPSDPFADHEETGIVVDADQDSVVLGWKAGRPRRESEMIKTAHGAEDVAAVADDVLGSRKWMSVFRKRSVGHSRRKKRKTKWKMPVLPPALQYRFPFNYIIILLSPILLPLLIALIFSRFFLDSTRSRKRLQRLAQVSNTNMYDRSGASSPSSHSIPSAHGLSIDSLRAAIRRVERNLESPLVNVAEGSSYIRDYSSAPASGANTPLMQAPFVDKDGDDFIPSAPLCLSETQLRMIDGLNKAMPHAVKIVSWFPKTFNSHAAIIVRDPKTFPTHEEGRPILRRWARGVIAASEN